MDRETAMRYCQSKPEACLEYPFGPEVAVFKIKGKVFALVPEKIVPEKSVPEKSSPENQVPETLVAKNLKTSTSIPEQFKASISLKCDPEKAQALRDIYPAITGGYHLNKKHWNTILLDGSVPTSELEIQIDHSYFLVFKGLRKQERNTLILRVGEDSINDPYS